VLALPRELRHALALVDRALRHSLRPRRSYAIFDWDNLFACLLAAASSYAGAGRALAYSNVIQSFKSKTAEGYLANCAGGGYKDQDRTEPLSYE